MCTNTSTQVCNDVQELQCDSNLNQPFGGQNSPSLGTPQGGQGLNNLGIPFGGSGTSLGNQFGGSGTSLGNQFISSGTSLGTGVSSDFGGFPRTGSAKGMAHLNSSI